MAYGIRVRQVGTSNFEMSFYPRDTFGSAAAYYPRTAQAPGRFEFLVHRIRYLDGAKGADGSRGEYDRNGGRRASGPRKRKDEGRSSGVRSSSSRLERTV